MYDSTDKAEPTTSRGSASPQFSSGGQTKRVESRLVELDALHAAESNRLEIMVREMRSKQDEALGLTEVAIMQGEPESNEQNQTDPNTYLNLSQKKFYGSERCREARRMLQDLVDSEDYDTDSKYFENGLDFCDRHLDRISKQPNLDIPGYLSNLRLMTRKRS